MEEVIRANITEHGLLIPKSLLKGIEKVEIHLEDKVLTIFPDSVKDSIFNLGSNPIESNLKDGSFNHDQYIYNSK